MKVIDLIADYDVGSTKRVSLTIVIGNSQIGGSVVKLGAKELADGQIKNLDLGIGNSLRGKKLKSKSVVADVNDRTNRTIITYRIKGGARDQEFVSSGTVDQDGDSIVYRALFNLI